MTENLRVTVVFCPRCGSTDAGEGDSEHAPPGYTAMRCGHCLHFETCDHWDIRFRWNTDVALAEGAALPRFVFTRGRLVEALRRLCGVAAVDEDAFASRPAVRVLCDRVGAAWSEPHRRYHSLQHLAECLRWLDDARLRDAIAERTEVELALFLHDLRYDTTRGDNEELSADESRAMLSALDGADPAAVERVCAMILATKAHVASTDDERAMLDVDLSILGADERRFAEYEQQIREEFHWVDREAYAHGRRAVLARFAERRPIYFSAPMRDALEEQAHENLRRALVATSPG
jgi:predicted metal-dependent HD superfamily phosphohydrolase